MKTRIFGIAAALALLLLAASSSRAQGRFEVTPFVGWETSGSYPISSTSGPPIDRLRINDAFAWGGFFDYNITENFQAEFMFNRNNTSYSAHDVLSDSYFNAYHSDVNQYQFGGLYMLRGSDHRLRPYVAASVGFTHDSNSNGTANNTAFSYSLGGGVKYYLSRHLGLRADARFLPTYGNSSIATYCDPFFGCYNAKVSNYLNRGSFTGGVIIHF
jgi:hypothetical protein